MCCYVWESLLLNYMVLYFERTFYPIKRVAMFWENNFHWAKSKLWLVFDFRNQGHFILLEKSSLVLYAWAVVWQRSCTWIHHTWVVLQDMQGKTNTGKVRGDKSVITNLWDLKYSDSPRQTTSSLPELQNKIVQAGKSNGLSINLVNKIFLFVL